MNRLRPTRWKTRLVAFVVIAITSMASIAMIVAVVVSALIATGIQYARARLRGTRVDRSESSSTTDSEE